MFRSISVVKRRQSLWLTVFLAGFLILLGSAPAAESAPRAPQGALVFSAETATVPPDGQAWLVNSTLGEVVHLHGAAAIIFDLASLKIPAGHYRFGFVLRTGTHWNDAQGQIAKYRWRILPTSGQTSEVAGMITLDHPAFRSVRESGEEDGWANWYGTVQASRFSALQGDEKIEVSNLENHGGIVALWIQPVSASNTAELSLRVDAPMHAFIHGTRPAIQVRLAVPKGLPRLEATLALEWLDLLTGKTSVSRSPVTLLPGVPQDLTITEDLKPGVYRVRARIDGKDGSAVPDELADFAQVMLAVSPARLAADLPDDWPLGAHVDKNLPPMPGFRWFRYFVPWSDIHKAPGVYDWDAAEFDRVFQSVREIGGRLMIAYDGSPLWTSSRPRIGMPWNEAATANPPDDWNVKRDYLIALIARTKDARGTLAALELCNEANTVERWQGTPEDMIAMARIFREAVKTSATPIKTVGLAVSAGHQEPFVNAVIDAGLLPHVDAVSAHFYEELMSHEPATPINNLPRHVDLVRVPMEAAGFSLPILNTESGIDFAPRVNGLPPGQDELNAAVRADPRFDPRQPWLLGETWTRVSERRAAATYVAGATQLLALGVTQTFFFTYFSFLIDGVPSLPWVALGRFGDALHGVDFKVIKPLEAIYPGSDGQDGSPKALAYIFGKPGERQVIVAWGFLSDTSIGRSKHWQRWLDPLPLHIKAEVPAGVLSDLYARTSSPIRSVGGTLDLACGEEPVFIEIDPAGAPGKTNPAP